MCRLSNVVLIYALDTVLDLPAETTMIEFLEVIDGHILPGAAL